jgi:hypothetical protein
MNEQDGGLFLWIGRVPKYGVRNDGTIRRVNRECLDFVSRISQFTEVRAGPVDEWELDGGEVRLRGERIARSDLMRARTLLIDVKSDGAPERARADALEQFIAEHYPQAAILNPLASASLFSSKIAFYEMASANPALRDTVVPHQVIRSIGDVDTAIDRFSFPIVLKPDDLAHGHGMHLVHDRKEFLAHVRAIRRHPLRYRTQRLLQPFRETARRWLKRPLRKEHHYLNNGQVVANPFVETIGVDVGGRIQLMVHYFGPTMVGLRAKVITQGWSSHSPGVLSSLEQMGRGRFGALATVVLDAVERSRTGLTALRRALPAWPIRFDAMIDGAGRVVVSEPEFKWGYREHSLYDGMMALGYDPAQIEARTGMNVYVDVAALVRARSHLD